MQNSFIKSDKCQQILKFHEWVISALKFELSYKRSQILVANSCEWMKFENLLWDVNLSIGRQGDLNYEAAPLSPFLNPPIPSHVRGACDSASVLHAVFMLNKLRQILKFAKRSNLQAKKLKI